MNKKKIRKKIWVEKMIFKNNMILNIKKIKAIHLKIYKKNNKQYKIYINYHKSMIVFINKK